jgi:hypothetical protein
MAPPDILPMGRIFQPGTPEIVPHIFSKTEVLFDVKMNSCA